MQVFNMSCCSKEKMERYDYDNTCKSHSAKSDREMYRICPSKLSKKELEDLYFTLLENNLELKKTINGQQDKIRVLSTQVQRMTNTHDKIMSKEMKECSTGTKAFLNEQKDFITELKETNQRMAERIQHLNMRLCSAKQFAKTTPPQTSNSRRFRPATASPPKKHNCITKDQDSEQITKLSTSSQWEDRTPRKTAQTQIIVPLEKRSPKSDQPCDENKCRFVMEELKIKIVTLQDELFNVHEEYSTRISRLETEVSEVRKENTRVCSERSASEHELQNTVKRTSDILAQYRLSEAKCSELTTELAIEKRKVAELETQLKAANMSDKVNKTIEEHLTTIQETSGASDDDLLKCNCGCPPPHLLPRVMNETAPIKTLPLVTPPKRRDWEDPSVRTKYNPSKGSPSTVTQSHSQLLSKSSPTKTVSEEMNCETCGCKPQLTSDPVPVQSPTPVDETNCDCKDQLTSDPASAENCKCRECVCPPPQDSSQQAKDEHAKCIKCCFKYEDGATESPTSKNGKFLSPRGATTPPSPKKEKDGTKQSKTGDDSGYQDTDELVLIKQNRELMTKILELQNQVDFMKIQMCEMSEAKPGKVSKSTESPNKTRDYAAVATAAAPLLGELTKVSELPEAVPVSLSSADNATATSSSSRRLLRELAQDKIPEEQIEYNKPLEGGNYKPTKQVPFPQMVSDEGVREPGKILSIEILGNPKEAVRTRNWDDTRAKTIEDADGTIKITEEASSDKFSPLDLMNDDYREHSKTDSPKLKIKEKKKLEIPGSSKLESANISLKSPTSDISGLGFNPAKLKYLEAEGIIAKLEFGEDMSKLNEDSSLTESVPSNPELGFGIPRLASKGSQNKAETDSGQAKKPPAAGPSPQRARDDLMEVLQGKLKLPMTEALVANHSTAPKQTDETKKKKEDCEDCAACSFDKECELKHENATNHKMNTLAPGMQKEQAKKHDQHNSLQIPGPIPQLESSAKDKMRHLFSHFMKDRSSKQKKEGFIINPKIYGQQTTATTDRPANLPDVPLLDKKQLGTDSIKIDKKILTHDKTDRSVKEKKGNLNKEDSIVDPTDGPASLPDVPFFDKSVDSKDDVEGKQSRIVFSVNNNADPSLLEVKMPTYRTYSRSERMLPTLLASSTNLRGKAMHVERKADVVQSTDPKLAEKSSQVPTNIESCREREVSPYRRRSGSLCYRAHSAGAPRACRCAGQRDGYCSDKPRKKAIEAHDKEDVKSPRDQRRALLKSNAGTYTLNSKQTSPDNTELEMSDLSDLPMEKEKKSTFKSRPLSPGEDKTTTFTTTHSYYSPPASWLSEGEMPAAVSKRKYSEPDIVRPYLNPALAHKLETPPSQQMEAALQAVCSELRRCTAMLHAQRPAQAVVNSRDKNLVLKWKFYDQAVTMARMHAGRVVVFDFSTEYDIKVTEDFLHYLKHEEMPIVICELDQEEEPFASCVLPLRDALLHTNTRADMSLALVAGPQMLKERANNDDADTFDTVDEVGVIDLWCLMRADANMLPGINLAIAQPGAAIVSAKPRHSRVMPQVLDDYNELDLTMGHARSAPLKPTGRNQTYDSVEYNRTSNTWSNTRSGRGKQATESDSSQNISYDPSKYPPIRERKFPVMAAPATSPSVPAKRYDAAQEKQRQTELIINEVNPKIKSPGDIRHAVERSNRLNDSMSRLNRSEDQFSQAPSSYGSLQTHGGDQRSFIEKLRKASRTGDGRQRNPEKNESTAMEKFMKYEYINKTTDTNKAEQSKKVTIMPKYTDTEIESTGDTSEEPPQNENQKLNMPKLEITVLWLALNEECEAMIDPHVQRVYVAYTFLGRSGAELETPVSLSKPKHYVDKCYFNFKKVFELSNSDLLKLGHMARCRAGSPVMENEKDCIIFSVVSEPADDPLGIESCEDIGYASLYLGDLLAYSAGSPGYTEVVPVRAARGAGVCGVLAVRLDGLDVVRRCLLLTHNEIAGHST